MSFFYTQDGVRNQTKTVTRRLGWKDLKSGQRVNAIVKGHGLNKGEKVQHICVIECVSNRPERLCDICDYDKIGANGWEWNSETTREGFPEMTGEQFCQMFCKNMGCKPKKVVNRIEFIYV